MEQSGWLDFLRRAQGITLECLAKRHGIQRSNISAFVTSMGEKKNVSFAKTRLILLDLGVLVDGVLLPGVHCWQIDQGMVTRLYDLLSINNYEKLFFFKLDEKLYSKVVFMVAQIAKDTFIFASFCSDVMQTIKDYLIRKKLSVNMRSIFLSRTKWICLHGIWCERNNLKCQKGLIDKLEKILDEAYW